MTERRTLVLFVLAGENMRQRYTDALRAAGVADVDLLMALPGAGSAINARYVLDAPGPGTRLERLARRMGARDLEAYGHVVVASYSAGYGAVREVLEEPASAERVSGYAAIDSVHDGLSLARLGWLVHLAQRATEGDAVLHLGHTDVPTPYASTTQVAEAICHAVGVRAPGPNEHVELGGLRIESHDHHAPSRARAEHSGALLDWGAALLARCVADVHAMLPEPTSEGPTTMPERTELGDRGTRVVAWQRYLAREGRYVGPVDGRHGPMTEMASDAWEAARPIVRPPALDMGEWDGYSLGERTLVWAGYELGQDIAEIRGVRHDPRILAYSRHCRRGGTLLGVVAPGVPDWAGGAAIPLPRDEDAWCAAFASAALLGALRVGEAPPHGLRVAVRELVTDARAAGAWRGPEYQPVAGDRAVWGRVGERPDRGGRGHVGIVIDADDEAVRTIDGNTGDRVALRVRPRSGIVGYIACAAAGT